MLEPLAHVPVAMGVEGEMGRLRQVVIGWVSEVSWRLPGGPSRLLTDFSQAERGSCLDMLAAVRLTQRRELRLKYFRHAMDEARHAGLFQARALAQGGTTRVQAVTSDAGHLTRRGIVSGQSLFAQLGERDFLAFVTVSEAEAIEQFNVYLDRSLPDRDTDATLRRILKDERFHVAYSRAALEADNDSHAVDRALQAARRERTRRAWLRASRTLGHHMTTLWLVLLYAVLVAPFAAVARLEQGGWRPVRAQRPGPSLRAARSQG